MFIYFVSLYLSAPMCVCCSDWIFKSKILLFFSSRYCSFRFLYFSTYIIFHVYSHWFGYQLDFGVFFSVFSFNLFWAETKHLNLICLFSFGLLYRFFVYFLFHIVFQIDQPRKMLIFQYSSSFSGIFYFRDPLYCMHRWGQTECIICVW